MESFVSGNPLCSKLPCSPFDVKTQATRWLDAEIKKWKSGSRKNQNFYRILRQRRFPSLRYLNQPKSSWPNKGLIIKSPSQSCSRREQKNKHEFLCAERYVSQTTYSIIIVHRLVLRYITAEVFSQMTIHSPNARKKLADFHISTLVGTQSSKKANLPITAYRRRAGASTSACEGTLPTKKEVRRFRGSWCKERTPHSQRETRRFMDLLIKYVSVSTLLVRWDYWLTTTRIYYPSAEFIEWGRMTVGLSGLVVGDVVELKGRIGGTRMHGLKYTPRNDIFFAYKY